MMEAARGQNALRRDLPEPLALVQRADERRQTNGSADPTRRSDLGQVLTPASVAEFMASMLHMSGEEVRLLDAGAGFGVLSAAAVEVLLERPRPPARIEITAVELDVGALGQLEAALADCARACEERDIELASAVVNEDLASFASRRLRAEDPGYTAAILNPPYRKLGSSTSERRAFEELGVSSPNAYAAFLGTVILLLEEGGEFVSINPRSFTNGTYFRPFRKFLLGHAALRRIHVFDARDEAFREDSVLQETVIVHGERSNAPSDRVLLSASASPAAEVRERIVPMTSVVDPADPQQFVRVVLDDESERVARTMSALPCTLEDLDIAVSTGRVVDFRSTDHLLAEPHEGAMPLIYPGHCADGGVIWPQGAAGKSKALTLTDETRSQGVPTGDYVLVRRFSAKEEPRRVVAFVCEGEKLPGPLLAFENHLNYFHRDGHGLPLDLARGLAAFLNTHLVDTYFRQFNGHTQVNAGDLRNIRYPSTDALMEAGRAGDDGADVEAIIARSEPAPSLPV
jgi:adenine-specific DNA-methyltransferase